MQTCKINPSFKAQFKVSIVGCGNVGATAAYAMLLEGTPSEIVLIDRDKNKAHGLLLDFEHSLPFVPHTKIMSSDDLEACRNSHLIVVAAGARQQEGETRLQLIDKTVRFFKKSFQPL